MPWSIRSLGSQGGNASIGTPPPLGDPASLIVGNGGFWRADRGVTQSGGSISLWADQTTFANNLTFGGAGQATASGVWASNNFNGSSPGVGYGNAGGSSNVQSGNSNTSFSFGGTTTWSIFMLATVFGNTAAPGNNTNFWSLTSNGNATWYNVPSFNGDSGSVGSAVSWDTFGSSFIGNGGAIYPLTTATNYLLGSSGDGAFGHLWVNGAEVGTPNSYTSIIGASPNKFQIGTVSGTANASANFILAFFGITQKAMTATDWLNLKIYCNANWGTSF